MKKRILLSLVSFFAMTAMWASLVEAYKIEVGAAAAGKTGATAELTLSMKNRNAIASWQCVLQLPEGVTYQSVAIVDGRYPEGYNAKINGVPGNDNTVLISCEGEEGVTLTGTDGAVAVVTVEIASTVTPGDYTIVVQKNKTALVEADGTTNHVYSKDIEYTWTIEQGEEPGIKGDLNGDGIVDIADAVSVLNYMAEGTYVQAADLNEDGFVDIADFVSILNLMAEN